MTKIQRAKLNKDISRENMSRAEIVQISRPSAATRSSGRQSYLIIFIFVMLFVGVFISFGSFGLVSPQNDRRQISPSVEMQTPPVVERQISQVTEKRVSKPRKESIFSSDNPNGLMIFGKNTGRVENIMTLFKLMAQEQYEHVEDPVKPRYIMLHSPQYPMEMTQLEENNSKCLSFDKYARMFSDDGPGEVLRTTNITREAYEIVPLCFVTKEQYHHGWSFQNLIPIRKRRHQKAIRSLMNTSLNIVEKLMEDEG